MANQTLSYHRIKEVLAEEKGGTTLTIQDKPPVIGENWKRAPCECQERMELHHSYDNDLQIINEMIEFRTQGARCPSHNTAQYAVNADKSQYGDMDKAMKLIPCSCNMKKYLDCDCDVKANLCECQNRTACPEDWHHVSVFEKTGDFTNKTCYCYTRTAICGAFVTDLGAYITEGLTAYHFSEVLNKGVENYLDETPQTCDCDSRTIYDCKCKFRHTEDCDCNARSNEQCRCRSRQVLSCVVDTANDSKKYGLYDSNYWYYRDASIIDCVCKERLFNNTTIPDSVLNEPYYNKVNAAKCECYQRITAIVDEVGNKCHCVERDARGCNMHNDVYGNDYMIGCECFGRDYTKIPNYDCLCKQRGMPEAIDCLRDGVDLTFCYQHAKESSRVGINKKSYYTFDFITANNKNTYISNNDAYIECDCVLRGFSNCWCDLRYSAYIQCKCNLRTGTEQNECDCKYRTYTTGCDIYNIDSRKNDNIFSWYTGDFEYEYRLYKLKNCDSNQNNYVSCTTDYVNMKDNISEDVSNYWDNLPASYYPSYESNLVYYIHNECDCKNRNANECVCKKRTIHCSCKGDTATQTECDCNTRMSIESEAGCVCKQRTNSSNYCNCDNQSVSCSCDLRTQDTSGYCDRNVNNIECDCRLRQLPEVAGCECKYRTSACSCYDRQSCLCVEKILMCWCNVRYNEFFSCFANLVDHHKDYEFSWVYCKCNSKILQENETIGEHLCLCQLNNIESGGIMRRCPTKYAVMKVNNEGKIPASGESYHDDRSVVFSGVHDFHKSLLDYSGFDSEE